MFLKDVNLKMSKRNILQELNRLQTIPEEKPPEFNDEFDQELHDFLVEFNLIPKPKEITFVFKNGVNKTITLQ